MRGVGTEPGFDNHANALFWQHSRGFRLHVIPDLMRDLKSAATPAIAPGFGDLVEEDPLATLFRQDTSCFVVLSTGVPSVTASKCGAGYVEVQFTKSYLGQAKQI